MARGLLLGLLAVGTTSLPSAAMGCMCAQQSDPVCARGDRGSLSTYGNPCQADCAGAAIVQWYACDELMPQQRGFELGMWPGSCVCPYQYTPVCSSDGVTYSNMCEAACDGAHVIQHAECSTLDDDKPDDDKPVHGPPDGSHGSIRNRNRPKTCVDCIAAGRSWQVGQCNPTQACHNMGVDTACYSTARTTLGSSDATKDYGCPDATPNEDPPYDADNSFDLVLNETGFDCSTRESWPHVKQMWCCQVFGLCDNAIIGGGGQPTIGDALDDLVDMLALSCRVHAGSPDKCASLPYCAYEIRDTFGNRTVVEEEESGSGSESGDEDEDNDHFPYLPPMGCVFAVHHDGSCDCVDQRDPCWEDGNCVESATCGADFESMFSNGAVPPGWRHRRATFAAFCTDSKGNRRSDGDMWTDAQDPCATFSCFGGQIMHTEMFCEPLACRDPVYTEGQCCGICEDVLQATTCVDDNGVHHRNGEDWTSFADPCELFSCYNGRIRHMAMACERPQCLDPVYTEGQCCGICEDVLQATCVDGNGAHHRNGEDWTPFDQPCSRFRCLDGIIQESAMDCPQSQCSNPVRVAGRCCNICPDNGQNQSADPVDCSRIRCAAIATCSDGSRPLAPEGNCCPSCDHIDDAQDCAGVFCTAIATCPDGSRPLAPEGSCCPSCDHIDDAQDCARVFCAAIATCSDGSRPLAPEGSCCPSCDHINVANEDPVDVCHRGFRMPFEAGEQIRVWNLDLTAFEPASVISGPNEFGWFVVDHRDGVRSSEAWCPRGPGMGDGHKRGRCVPVDMPVAHEGCLAASNDRDKCETDPDCIFKQARWQLGRNLQMHGDRTTEIGLCIEKQWNEAIGSIDSGSGSGSGSSDQWHLPADCGWLGLKCHDFYNAFGTGSDPSDPSDPSGSGSSSNQTTNTTTTTTTTTITTTTLRTTTLTPTPTPTQPTAPPSTGLVLPDNYELLDSDRICIKNNMQWASNRGISDKGGGLTPCFAACDSVADCNFVVYTKGGKCQFYKECASQSRKPGAAIYQRTSKPPSPPAAETPEFTLGGEGFLCKKTNDQHVGGLAGGRHSLEECMVGCGQHADCRILSFTSSGYCRYYSSCNKRSDKNGAQVWGLPGELIEGDPDTSDEGNSADVGVVEFPVHAEGATCAKVSTQIASVFGIKGSGTRLADCKRHCLTVDDCRFITHTERGYCKFFSRCDRMQNKGSGVTTYSRPGMVSPGESNTPTVTFTELATGQMCNRSPAQIASTPAIKGGSSTLQECQSGCAGMPDCRFITLTRGGNCRFWKSCTDRITNKPHVVIYARDGAPEAEPTDTDGTDSTVAAAFENPIDGQQCDKSKVRWASSKGPAGPGHDTSDCMAQCLNVPDCRFISMTPTGMCRFFPSCDESERLDKRGTIFARLVDADPPPNAADTLDRVQVAAAPRNSHAKGPKRAQNGGRRNRQ